MNVSVNTVKSQRRSILKKLGANSLEEALANAERQRLLEDKGPGLGRLRRRRLERFSVSHR